MTMQMQLWTNTWWLHEKGMSESFATDRNAAAETRFFFNQFVSINYYSVSECIKLNCKLKVSENEFKI